MPIEFTCHVCRTLLRTADDTALRTAKCPGCGESLIVPQAEATAAAQDEKTHEGESGDGDFGAGLAPGAAPGATRVCPMCGEQINRTASRCRSCGQEFDFLPHRGPMILTLGLLSFFLCPIFGIIAWVMGNADLKEIQAGRMDSEGKAQTQAGKIIAIVSICLWAAVMLMWCVMAIFVVAVGGA